MGGSLSLCRTRWDIDSYDEATHSKWRIKPSKSEAKKAYENDGTLPRNASKGLLALRVFLEDPNLLCMFASFVKQKGMLDYLVCWIEVLEYKMIDNKNAYKLSKANHIYHKYFKEDAVVFLPQLCEAISINYRAAVQASIWLAEDSTVNRLQNSLFDELGQICLMIIHEYLYVPYKASGTYVMSLQAMKQQYNYVSVDDFEYMEYLGQGSFGWVVHCKKKSTGKHYAMKIQTKLSLLKRYAKCLDRVTGERDVLSKCHHPFIISMDYALQTPQLAIMVTALGTGESLRNVGILSEERVKFYAAEIVLALDYIHGMGLIYRDLKPANVLLNADGHIQLVDMGGIVDVAGKTVGKCEYEEWDDSSSASGSGVLPPASIDNELDFVADLRPCNMSLSNGKKQRRGSSVGPSEDLSPQQGRAQSIMGTSGFMAPEMLIQLSQKHTDRLGYSRAVDYWSLGGLLFVLLTGKLPFHHEKVAGFMEHLSLLDESNSGADAAIREVPGYERFYKILTTLDCIPLVCQQFISGLLTIDEHKRLGSGPNGVEAVKNHLWFSSIQWSLMAEKLVRPPSIEESCTSPTSEYFVGLTEKPLFASFWDMCDSINMKACLSESVNNQLPFAKWDFIAPAVLKNEVGAEEMEQFRLVQLRELGSVKSSVLHSQDVSFFRKLTKLSRVACILPELDDGTFSIFRSNKSSQTHEDSAITSVYHSDRQLSNAYFGTTKDASTILDVSGILKELSS